MRFLKSIYVYYFVFFSLTVIGIQHIQKKWNLLQNTYAYDAQHKLAASDILYTPTFDMAHYSARIIILHTQVSVFLLTIGILYCLFQIFNHAILKKTIQISIQKYMIACTLILIPMYTETIVQLLSSISFDNNLILFLPFILLGSTLLLRSKISSKNT